MRKLAVVCMPVFFDPDGSSSQLIFGLMICFLTFGMFMLWSPYISDDDDRVAQLCQVQIFFSLLASLLLKVALPLLPRPLHALPVALAQGEHGGTASAIGWQPQLLWSSLVAEDLVTSPSAPGLAPHGYAPQLLIGKSHMAAPSYLQAHFHSTYFF